jgi:hypothetical protein
MTLKLKVKRAIPPSVLNNFLLTFPFLYRTKLVNYEANLQPNHGIDELLKLLGMVLRVEGNIIECGSSRCGTSIIMANYLRAKDVGKIIYACDSFQGFDPTELEKERQAGLTKASHKTFTSTSYNYVKRKINKLGFEDIVIPIRGFFRDTLPEIESNFCFALIDCDLKESIIYCAETIWPHLMNNGVIVFDDYTSEEYRGGRDGIDYFVNEHESEFSEHGLMTRLYYVCKK